MWISMRGEKRHLFVLGSMNVEKEKAEERVYVQE